MRRLLILLLLVISFTFAFGETTTVNQTNVATNPNKSPYIKDGYVYKPTSCSDTCEEVKDGYFTRVTNNVLEKGLLTCSIYSIKNPLKVLETRISFNRYCKEKYTFMANKSLNNAQTLHLDEQLTVLENKYFKNFVNTGDVQFLTAPEYLVAVLTANAKIINIKETIQSNQIVLNPEYTIYPNENTQYEPNFVNKVYSLLEKFNPFSEEKNSIIPIENYPTKLVSSSSQLISTIGVFWLDFLTEINSIYQETNFLLVLLLVPFSLVILAGENYTQRLSNIQPQNNLVGGAIISILVCLGMFVSYTTAVTGETDFIQKEKKLDQTFYQNSSSNLISEGVRVANTFNAGFNKVYINQMARNASVNPSITQEERFQKLEFLKNLYSQYQGYLNTCSQIYNIDTLRNIVSNVYDMPLVFPPTESYGSISFYSHLNNPDNLITNNLYAVNFCYQIDRNMDLYAGKIRNLSKEIQNTQKALDNGMEDRVLNIAEVGYKNAVEMGFLSALTTASMNATLSNLEEYQYYSDNLDEKRAYIKEETIKSIKTYSDIDASDFLENDLISIFPKYISYFSMPFFSNVYDGVSKMASFGGDVAENYINSNNNTPIAKKPSLNSALGMQPKANNTSSSGILDIMGNFIIKIAKANPAFSVLEALLSAGSQAIILAISIYIYDYFLQLLVPFAILSAGLIVVLYWIAEIIIYYLVIPFMLAYAMLKGQGHAISKFLARGLIIATRPTLLVFSIIVAILLNSLYESISVFIITKNFSALFGLNELGMIDTFTGLIQQGFFEIALRFIIPIIMFFIILTGSTIFLKQFGYSDEADFGQQFQNSVESRGSKYSLPV